MTSSSASLRDWGRLARLSLAPSAIADVACGVLLGHGGNWPDSRVPWLLMASSLSIYHGAMVLNDWADQKADAKTRPDRPIPAGRIESSSALAAGTLLLFFGLGAALMVGPSTALWMGIVAWLAWTYTTRGRGPWIGPLLLAACRAGNLGAGLIAAEDNPVYRVGEIGTVWLLPTLYAGYVFVVSRLGRMEDSEDGAPLGSRPQRLLLGLAAILVAVPFTPIGGVLSPTFARGAALVVAILGASGLLKLALKTETWTPGLVMAAMGCCLRRLLIFSAAATLLLGTTESYIVGGCILMGYPASWLLRGLFPPS